MYVIAHFCRYLFETMRHLNTSITLYPGLPDLRSGRGQTCAIQVHQIVARLQRDSR